MSDLTLLGNKTPVPAKPEDARLETFENPGVQQVVFNAPEFTSHCPITGQPDWGQIVVMYVPDKLCIESKSLKLYLHSYRDFRGFAEAIANKICKDLFAACEPLQMQVDARFNPRGGIGLTASCIMQKIEKKRVEVPTMVFPQASRV